MGSDAAAARASSEAGGKGRVLASINYFGDCLWQLGRPQPQEPNAGFSVRGPDASLLFGELKFCAAELTLAGRPPG